MPFSFDPNSPSRTHSGFVLLVAILASGMAFIDASVIGVAAPQMRSSLAASFGQIQWVQNSYLLFLVSLMLLAGACGDRYGLRRVFGFGIIVFVLASLLCALASNIESLIFFRVLQGVGGAVMVPGSMALISINTRENGRGRALGIWVAASASLSAIGPLIAGIVLTYGGEDAWRWIFALNFPIGLLALTFLWVRVPRDKPKTILPPLDIVGAVLCVVCLGCFSLGLTLIVEQGEQYISFGLLAAGLVFGAFALRWESQCPYPMIDLRLFRSLSFSGANIITFLIWSGLAANTFFLPMVLIVAWKLPATYAGGLFVPFAFILTLLAPIVGRLADKYGVRVFLTIGPLIVALGQILLGWGIVKQDYWFGVIPALLVLGVGMSACATPVSAAIMKAINSEKAGTASGVNNMIARLSNLVAIAGFGAFLSYIYRLMITGSDLHQDIQELMLNAGFGERLTGGLYQISTVNLQAVGMNHAMIALCVLTALMAAIASLVGWFTQEPTLR